MKRALLLIVSFIVLVGCQNTTDTPSKNENSNETTQEIKENNNIKMKVKDIFDNNAKVEKVDDVVSGEIGKPHTEYKITINNNEVIEANDRIFSNQGTDEDRNKIREIQEKTRELAQELENDLDAVVTHYIDKDGNSILLAYSQKSKDIIPIVE
ncbi:hypothetical protein [Facklamia sp. P9177]|uniref:hypothetical protein n=1 Tax=Facklamia sp. P9177 TaxID=3421945 RepID=UPI003D178549